MIPLDFVDYLCNDVDCAIKHNFHFGQIDFFDQDWRSNSVSKNNILLEVYLVKKTIALLFSYEILALQVQ